MKQQHILVSNTNDQETIEMDITEKHLSIDGDGWAITIVQQGLVTQAIIHANDEDTIINLKNPTHREVRAKVRENGRTPLNDLERAILDTFASNV